MRIIGIDPGSRCTGYGIVDVQGRSNQFVKTGVVKTDSADMPERLARIFEDLSVVIQTYRPDAMSVERVFMHQNADAALKLGQARGAAICAGVSQQVKVYDFSPTEVKKNIVGNGRASKDQMAYMVRVLLKINHPLQQDSADALGMALCLAHHLGTEALKR